MKIIELAKKRKYYLLALLIFWILVLFVFDPLNPSKGNTTEYRYGFERVGVASEIVEGTVLEQRFTSQQNHLKQISLYMGTYERENTGTLQISVIDEASGDTVVKKEADVSDFVDNTFYELPFEPQAMSEGRTYVIRLTSDEGTMDNSVTVFASKVEDGCIAAEKNGETCPFMLAFKIGYDNAAVQYVKVAAWLLLLVLSVIYMLLAGSADEKTFLKFAFLLGVLVVIFNPFAHFLDESTHFFRSYMVSQGDWLDSEQDDEIGGKVAENYEEIMESELTLKSYFSDPEFWNQRFSDQKEFYVNPYMASVAPLNHAVAAVGIFIANLLHLPAVLVIILGRLCDYLFYVGFCYLAIKKATHYKSLFFIVATLPMSVWLAGSFSIDPVLVSASLLFTSICLKHYFGGESMIPKSEMALLLVCGIFIVSVKYMIYTPILLLFFLIPRSKFTKKQYIGELAGAIVIVLTMVALQVYLLGRFQFEEDRNGDVDVGRQLAFMGAHVWQSVRVMVSYWIQNLQTHLSGLYVDAAFATVGSLCGLLTIAGAVLEPAPYRFLDVRKKRRFCALCLSVFAISFVITLVSLYIGYTPVGEFGIDGVQTRYLLPLLLFLMLPLSMIRVHNHISNYGEKLSAIIGIGAMNMLAGMLLAVF